MTQGEKLFFINNVAQSYFTYLKKHATSLLARIYGVYTVKIEGLDAVHLMLMAHTMQINNSCNIERVFDLKGSTVDRKVKVKKSTKNTKTLKD